MVVGARIGCCVDSLHLKRHYNRAVGLWYRWAHKDSMCTAK
jgi:hypothetical protein